MMIAPATNATAVARLRSARIATGVVFAVHGAANGTFATRIPWIRDRLGLGTGELGLALLVSLVAGFLPSRRAMRMSALSALRYE